VVNSEGDKDYSKMIHLDYHVLVGDPLYCVNASSVADRLNGISSASTYVFFGSVDRTDLSTAGGSKAEYDIGLSQSSYTVNSSWGGDMETAIGSEESNTPPDNMNLVSATLDKSTQYYTFSATVSVNLASSISDSLIIRYAILEDGLSDPVCGTTTPLNDVVRYITTGDSVVFVPGASGVKNVTFTQADLLQANPGEPGALNPDNLRFVAFLESSGGGDYSVVDAKQLISNFSTLPAPAPTLTFNEHFISGDTLSPGSTAQIFYAATNLPNGVSVYYSLDDGTTWRFIENSISAFGPANWVVPDSVTKLGKIKLVAVGDDTLISIEKGTFTIANPPSVTILKPQAAQVLKGGSNDTVTWTNISVTANTLEYYLAEADGDFVTPHVLGTNLTDTFFVWAVPDTDAVVEIKIVPANNEAPAFAVIDTIEGNVITPPGSVASSNAPTGLTITNVFPNPASNGQEIVVQYSEAQPTPVTIQLLDLLGRVMPETYTTDNLAIHLNTSSLEAGAYVVRLSDGTTTVSKRVEIIR
jgi:Secretion system C-terminal sorting domain